MEAKDRRTAVSSRRTYAPAALPCFAIGWLVTLAATALAATPPAPAGIQGDATTSARLDLNLTDPDKPLPTKDLTSSGPAGAPAQALGGGDTCATATIVPTIPFSDTGNTCGATNDYDVQCPSSGSTAPDVIYSYTPPADLTVNISLCANTAYDSKLYIFANTCPGTVVACNDDACSTPSFAGPDVSRLDGIKLLAGNTYYIVVDGFLDRCGDYTIDITPSSPGGGETCADATPIATLPFSDSGNTCGAADDYTSTCGGFDSGDVVYSYTPDVNMKLDVSLCAGSGYDTILYVFEDNCSGTEIACNDDSCPNYVSSLQGLSLTAGHTYYIVIDGYRGECGGYTIDVDGQPACALECPPDATLENEACGSTVNDGCNMATPAFEPIVPGQTVCGTCWQSLTARDTDWFQVDLTARTILTWTVQAEFPAQVGFLNQTVPGVPGCANMPLPRTLSLSAYGEGNCEPLTVLSPALDPGSYYLFVSAGYTPGFSCSANNHYLATLTGVPANPQIRVQPPAMPFNCADGQASQAGPNAPLLQPDVSPPGKLIDANEINQAFARGNGRADVIVNLSKPIAILATTDFDNPRSLSTLQNDVNQRQAAVLASLPASEFTSRYRYKNLAAFSGSITQAGLARLQKDPAVISIEPVRLLEAHLAQGIPLINGLVYRSTYNGSGVAIAVCDTGIDYTHPMLGGGSFPNSKVIGGYDFGEDDPDPIPVGQAHGTCCAGIAAGDLGSVGDYIGGVAYNARLYAVKIAPDNSGSANSDAMAAAWDWCVTHKNDDPNNPILVISTSFGGGRYYAACDSAYPVMTNAAAAAAAAGITIVASAGNDGYCDSIAWPACISNVISVGALYDAAFGTYKPCVNRYSCATKSNTNGCSTGYYATDDTAADLVTSYSNSASFLTVLAPSNQAYTTDIVGPAGYSQDDYFPNFGGTSAACPYTAGSVACLQQAAKAITGGYISPFAVKNALTGAGDPIADPKVPSIVKPRVNLGRAIDSLTPCGGQTLRIYNDGNMPLTITSITTSPWLTLTPTPAAPYTILQGAAIDFCTTMNCDAACTPGTPLQGAIEIASDDPLEPSVAVAVQTVCPAVPEDLDNDGDVDADDLALFETCFSGPAMPHAESELCARADADDDLDVDQSDFGVFQRCFSGTGRRANSDCAN